ncbi:MAG: enoyl-CoA hydratase [Hydrocarboniphaga sp.]|uniref:enoyl-CoA hydratase/isomerase family protein n=1 Tax=Hydrocarboniphaga sp. TaxID=2033016 RepID=UPI002622BAFF|nr:enoyl-CoA hydratase/isomerase family protein [Hydrocarboniphaga sp.]MDB5971138.1 enoyl-CoA hydratase [Hydrocarboniphaga sp.]
MDFNDLTYERRGGAAWIRLNRPDQMNPLSKGFIAEAHQVLDAAMADPTIFAVVFSANGRGFCAGADLKFINEYQEDEREAESNRFIASAAALMDRLEAYPKPVIAAVNGLAAGGGMELLLSCDLVYAAKSARIGDGHANYGLLPGAGASARLPRKIGANRANYLFFTGDLLPVERFVECGLINQIVEDAELVAAVDAVVAKIATKSPIGLSRMKMLAVSSLDQPMAASIRLEQLVSQLHTTSRDRNEGIAAFNEKRRPIFTGC